MQTHEPRADLTSLFSIIQDNIDIMILTAPNIKKPSRPTFTKTISFFVALQKYANVLYLIIKIMLITTNKRSDICPNGIIKYSSNLINKFTLFSNLFLLQ